jgi:autotransporter-associated beta strand protein
MARIKSRIVCFSARALMVATLLVLPLCTGAQTLTITNGVQTYTALTNTTVTMTGRSELRITTTNNPIPGCLINLNSSNAWFLLTSLRPAVVSATYLGQVRVNGAVAVSGSNVRIVPYAMGTVIVPHAPNFTPLQIFTGPNFLGASAQLGLYTYYTNATLGAMFRNIGSFRLKRGYLATFAHNADGTGASEVFVAQDGDLDIGMMPTNLDRVVSFVRVIPWRWTAKRGWADTGGDNGLLNAYWFYDWGNGHSSSLNSEFVPMKWSGGGSYSGYNSKQNSPQLLGFNEPDKSDQANMSVAAALSEWPNLMQCGLRVGAPGVSDTSGAGFGKSWLYSFMSQADALGYRVDYVPVHAYCPASSASALLSYLQDVYNQTRRPVWLTEFNFQANWCGGSTPTFDQEATVIGQMIDALEASPFVERYSIFNWLAEPTRQMFTNNVLTPAGLLYRDKPSNLAFTQTIPIAAGNRSIAQLQFEDDTADSSGFGNNGTAVGIPDYTDGPRGRAVVLDGTNNFVQLPGTIGNSASFSFAGWVYWNGGGNWQRIFDFGSDTSHYLFLTPRSGSGTFRFAINTGSGEQLLQTAGALPTGQWCHVAFTLAGGVGRLYTNGVQVASGSITFAPSATSPNKSYLGKSQFAADPLFSGSLDDVQIADYAFTPAQIASLMTNTPPQFITNTIAGGSADRGVPYTNNIAGAAFDTDPGDAIAYSKASGPAWLNVHADGSLTGTPGPNDGGTNYYTIRVMDAAGASAYALLTIDMPPVPNPLTDGTWIANLDGNWSDTNKWSSGAIANGAGFTADFSTLNISADRTVTLDTSRSIGTLKFNDTSGGQNWTLASSSGGTLTLDSGSLNSPNIFVSQNTATISAPLAGANGFAKTGVGTLVLDAANSLSGSLFIDTGSTTVNEGIVRIAEPSAVANVTNIWIRNNNGGSSTLQLDGSGASVTIPGRLTINCRNVTVPTIENLAGSNTLAGLISIDVGGNMFNLQSDAGVLVITATNRYIGSLTGGRNYNFTGAGDHLVTGPILNSTNTAPIGLIKSGTGTLTLAGANTYTNTTTVNGGTLLVNGSIGAGAVTVAGGATLGGNGVIKGAVTVQFNGVLSPGESIGKLSVSNSVTLNAGSTTVMEIDRSIPTNDVLKVSGLFTQGGALLITNVGPDLQMGDFFDLFEAGPIAGGFSSIALPVLNAGLRWNTNSLAASGVIAVEPILPPQIAVSATDGTNLVFQLSSQTGATYVLQSATNILDSPVLWFNEQTNSGTGAMQTFLFPIGAEPQRFFRVMAY